MMVNYGFHRLWRSVRVQRLHGGALSEFWSLSDLHCRFIWLRSSLTSLEITIWVGWPDYARWSCRSFQREHFGPFWSITCL